MDEQETATIKALALAQLLQTSLNDGGHALTPSSDFKAELARLIDEAERELGDI